MRYLRLYKYFVLFSFSRAFEFRLDFFFRIIMDCVYYFVQFYFFKTLYLHTNYLGSWNYEQIKLFVCGYILLDALNMTLFSNNTWWLPVYINKGMLDYYLIRPASSFFFLTMRDFAANSFFNLVIALGVFVYQFTHTSLEFNIFEILAFFLLILNGAFLYNLIHILIIIPTFWTQSSKGFAEVFYSMTHIMERPDVIYKGFTRKLFMFVFPFIIMSSFPARFLFGQDRLYTLGMIALVTSFFWAFTLYWWRRGLMAYSSASS